MKKVLITLFAVMALSFAAKAQSNAIGIRGGYGAAEISYQHALSAANRLEFDLGWWGGKDWTTFNLVGTYQWTGNITGILGWFAGPGAQVRLYKGKVDNKPFGIGIGGQAGLELDFNIPLQLTLDARPMWHFLGYYSGFGADVALGLRYRF